MIPKIKLQYNEETTYRENYLVHQKWWVLIISFLSWDYRQTIVDRKKQFGNAREFETAFFYYNFEFLDEDYDSPELLIPILKNRTTCYRCGEQYPESQFVWDPKWGKVCQRCKKIIQWGQTILDDLERSRNSLDCAVVAIRKDGESNA